MRGVVYRVLREYRLLSAHRPGLGDLEDVPRSYIRFVVAEAGGRIVGCAGLRRLPGRQARLQRMYLLPRARGRGLGRAMLRGLLSWARRRGLRRVWLESSRRYEDALRLYLAHGFQGGLLDDSGCCGVILFKDLA